MSCWKAKDDDDIYRAGKLFLDRMDIKEYIAADCNTMQSFKNPALMAHHEEANGFILNAADAMDAKRTAEKNRRPLSGSFVCGDNLCKKQKVCQFKPSMVPIFQSRRTLEFLT